MVSLILFSFALGVTEEDIYMPRVLAPLSLSLSFSLNIFSSKCGARTQKRVRWISGARCHARLPGVRPAVRIRTVAHRYAFSVGKDKKHKGETGEEQKKRREKEEYAKNRCILCSDPSLSWYRPVERSAESGPVNVPSDGSLFFFSFKHFFFLRMPSCVRFVRSVPLVRVFDYECLVLRHRARATFASRLPFRTEGIDNFFDAFPKRIAFHTS